MYNFGSNHNDLALPLDFEHGLWLWYLVGMPLCGYVVYVVENRYGTYTYGFIAK